MRGFIPLTDGQSHQLRGFLLNRWDVPSVKGKFPLTDGRSHRLGISITNFLGFNKRSDDDGTPTLGRTGHAHVSPPDIVLKFKYIDPEEERRILAREKKASLENFSSTLKRHTLVLKKRDLMRRKAEEERKKVINQLLAAEGLELDTDDEAAA
ncbi:hypothetical protein Taro_041545 [Colocasia esculenta]|uniref:Uncharacterized protein n=1 Tax=Colocasia esculenta TaxID=4460 RepID=A0A843WQ70_COLES|nr:hypothetical protein [Colocasia esculenta]